MTDMSGTSTICKERAARRNSIRFDAGEVSEVLQAMGLSSHSGTPLGAQAAEYGKLFGQWTEPDGSAAGKEGRRRIIEGALEGIADFHRRILAAPNFARLQQC